MAEMSILDWIAFVLVVIGGINWGLAVFDYNLVTSILGEGLITTIIYALVGLSAVFAIIRIFAKK